ncbi:hypothetical protein [Rhizobium sp. GCM10022189]|uniref:hypothetical protein n=1 Tax=Rhizobium sp. GCM10022189 TaxID=3252654 RepID=UPI00360DC60B
MDNMQPYDDLKRRQQAAAAASYIQSSDENPDEVANNLNLAREFSATTGKPVPPPQLVAEHPDFFQKQTDDARNKAILSSSPRLARWLSENATATPLAEDDLHNLSSLEKLLTKASEQPASPTVSSPPIPVPSSLKATFSKGPIAPPVVPANLANTPYAAESRPIEVGTESTTSTSGPASAKEQAVPPVAQPVAFAPGLTQSKTNTDTGIVLAPQPTPLEASDAALVPEQDIAESEKRREELINKILKSAYAPADQIPALEEEIRLQPWFDAGTGKIALDAVRARKTTPDEVRTMLTSKDSLATPEKAWGRIVNFSQGVAHGAVTATDRILDGTAWLLGDAEEPERDALIEEVIRAGSLRSEPELRQLREKLWKQTWFNPTIAMSVLSGILDGSATPEDARAQLGGGPTEEQVREGLEVVRQNGAEVLKGTASTAVTEAGRLLEGVGQLLSSPLSAEEQALVDGIANARNLKPDGLALLKKQIQEHSLFMHPRTANAILGGVLEGKITPDQARERMSPMFSDFFKGMQTYGAELGDYGETLFPAAPGYENSFGRQVGEMIGSNLAGIAATGALGPGAGLAVEMLRGAGDGAAAARKAGKTEEEQMVAAMLYSMTAFSDKIPAGKIAGPIIERVTKNPILQEFLKQAVQEGSAQALQQTLQNLIKRFNLNDENQEALDKVGGTARAGGVLGVLKTLLDMLLNKHGPDLKGIPVSALQPDGVQLARQTIGEISRYAQASKTRARSNDTFHDFVATATRGTLVSMPSVPADAFVDHFTAAGIDPYELAESRGMTRHDLAIAKASGADVRIPMPTYATYFAGSKHDAFLMDNMRFQPGAQTAAEATQLRKQGSTRQRGADRQANRILAYALANNAAEKRVYRHLASQAHSAGYPEETASRYAITYPALYSTMAAADGLSLNEYLNRYPLS